MKRRSKSVSNIYFLQDGNSSSHIIRRKSNRLSVRQTTVMNGALKLNPFPENEKSKLGVSANVTSSDNREKQTIEKKSPEMRLNDRSDLNDASKIAELLEKKDRRLVDSGFMDSPTCSEHSRSTNESHSPIKDMQSNDLHTASITSAAVKKWKHYKIAMEAYRKSSGKSPDDPESDGISSAMSLPVRGGKNDAARRSIFNYWDVNLDGCILETAEQSQTDRNSVNSSGSSVDPDFSPAQKQEQADALCFDYRSLLRSKGLKKGHRNSITQLKGRDSKRISVESDIITDIDTMVGFSPNGIVPEPTVIKDEEKNDSQRNSASDSQPEKIVWSHYDNYFQQKSDVTYISLNDVNPKKQSATSSYEKKARSNTDLSDVVFESDGVNLRDSQLIRKRNFSSSNIISPSADPPSPLMAALPPANDSQKFHTIASSARLAKLLKRQQRKGATVRSKEKSKRLNEISVISGPINLENGSTITEPTGKPPLSRDSSAESILDNKSIDMSTEEKAERPVFLNLERRSVNERKLGRKFRLGSTKSRSLSQLHVIGSTSLTSTPVDSASEEFAFHRAVSEKLSVDAMLDGMAKVDLNNGAGIFSTLTRRRLSSPFHKKKTFKSSTKRRSIKASDIVHTQLNANGNNNNNAILYDTACNRSYSESIFRVTGPISSCGTVCQSDSCLDKFLLQNASENMRISSICTNCNGKPNYLEQNQPHLLELVTNVTKTTEFLAGN